MGKPVAGEVVVFPFPQTNLQSGKLKSNTKPESLTRSLRKPKPAIARARPRPFREIWSWIGPHEEYERLLRRL